MHITPERETACEERNRRDEVDNSCVRQTAYEPKSSAEQHAQTSDAGVVTETMLLAELERIERGRDELLMEVGRMKLLVEQTNAAAPVESSHATRSQLVVRRATVGSVSRPACLELTIGDTVMYGALDSGSEVTLIPTEYSEGMQLELRPHEICAVNGTELSTRGAVEFCAHVGGVPIQIAGFVSDHVHNIVLGLDFIRAHVASWRFSEGIVVINGVEHQLHADSVRKHCRRIVLGDEIILPSSLESVARANESQWATAQTQASQSVNNACALILSRATEMPVLACNANAQPVHLASGVIASRLDQVDDCDASIDRAADGIKAERHDIFDTGGARQTRHYAVVKRNTRTRRSVVRRELVVRPAVSLNQRVVVESEAIRSGVSTNERVNGFKPSMVVRSAASLNQQAIYESEPERLAKSLNRQASESDERIVESERPATSLNQRVDRVEPVNVQPDVSAENGANNERV
jgi:hypothetical protein